MNDDLVGLASSVVMCGVREDDLDALRYPFGGYIFFDRNASSLRRLRALTDRLRARYADLPPILAIDQEGGRVMRLREGVAPMPSAATIGRTGDERLAHATAARCAYDLRRAGCNLNLAPVLDLALEEKNTVIGDRSFGSDPATVTRIAGAFARGLEEGGVVATFKHFPGHGATTVDSHEALPTIAVDEDTLRTRDLVPFAALLPGARAVMTAHVLVPAFDTAHPATLSSQILNRILREEIGFRGLCFTDCLEMGAVAANGASVAAASAALGAGADVLSVSHDTSLAGEIVDRIVDDVRDGRLERRRLEEAAARAEALRARLAAPLPL